MFLTLKVVTGTTRQNQQSAITVQLGDKFRQKLRKLDDNKQKINQSISFSCHAPRNTSSIMHEKETYLYVV